MNQQYSAILINGTTSTTNASTAVLIQIVDQNNSLVKHYHFGGSSSVHSVSEAFALIKKPTGGFAVSGCYRGGAAYIENYRLSSYGSGTCRQGFLVSFNNSFEIEFAKEMQASGSGVGNADTWGNLVADASGNIYISGNFRGCNSEGCLEFYDTDNSGNVKKSSAISASCTNNMGYIYVAKINSNGAWQWVSVAGGSTSGPGVSSLAEMGNSVYVAGQFDSCFYGLTYGGATVTSTANFGSYSFSATGRCWSQSGGYACSAISRAFVAEISSSGTWSNLINTSGDLPSTYSSSAFFSTPTDLQLESRGSDLYLAGEFSGPSWGLKFGDYTIPSSVYGSFIIRLDGNLSHSDSLILGSE